MRRVPIALLLACVASAHTSCASPTGILYTHTIQPLTTNLHETPVVQAPGTGDVKQVEYYVRALWGDNGIGDIAKQHGFAEVYYADLETLSVLGIWTQEWVHVYGATESGSEQHASAGQ